MNVLRTTKLNPTSFVNMIITQVRSSSYKSSPFVCDLEPQVKYEESRNPEEWKYVENVLPPLTVPKPKLLTEYKSGWKPQTVESLNHTYFVKRTKNHMIPVYMETTYRGSRRITVVRLIEGDIWQLQNDLKAFLKPMSKSPIRSQVHEFAGRILVHGDYVNAIKHFLTEKNF